MDRFYRKIQESTQIYLEKRNKEGRKQLSQFFTPLYIAELMASKIEINKYQEEITILEPSAGLGILLYCSVKRLLNTKVKKIIITAIEYDEELCIFLKENLGFLKKELEDKVEIEYEVINGNFIEVFEVFWTHNQPKKNEINLNKKFDLVISNPPFKKINKNSKDNIKFGNLIAGQPNIYHLFIALSLETLNYNGQYILISPKNYLGGKYTENLRKFIFDKYSLIYLHLFNERKKVFGNEVLQEICISKYVNKKEEEVEVMYNYDTKNSFKVNIKNIFLEKTCSLIFPQNKEGLDYIKEFLKKGKTLYDQGLKFNIGKVVQFRINEKNKSHERFDKKENNIPLLITNHIKRNKIEYQEIKTSGKEKVISISFNEDTKNKLIKNENYVIFRKNVDFESEYFIQATVYSKESFVTEYIAIDNNLVYISEDEKGLTLKKAQKICRYLNSKEFEKYYKMINNSHTINSYEINQMLFPIF